MKSLVLATVVSALMAAVPAAAGQSGATATRIDVSKLGPQVIERVPDSSLKDQTGKTQTLQSIMGRRGAVLVFVRATDSRARNAVRGIAGNAAKGTLRTAVTEL